MTNPTTPFSWQMPTSTDLVTDLPADFEVFGQAVATSMADLLGGTTGQVLAKASNTNMDFTWVAQDDSNAIQNAIVDAKGDLIGATANDTPARLAVGTNGTVLTADSAEATGLKWVTPTTNSMTLLSTTSLSGTSTTISSISTSYKSLFILLYGVTPSANAQLYLQPNTSANICNSVISHYFGATPTVATDGFRSDDIYLAGGQNFLASNASNAFSVQIDNYTSTSFFKPLSFYGGNDTSSAGNAASVSLGGGLIKTTSAITSLKFGMASGTFTGTVLVYGVS
jgi:hypothetical protein